MTQYRLDQANRFVITGYPTMRPFSSFLPGIGGLSGIPLWVFYVNRGQAISSFGVETKDSPMMEFHPANKAYQNTPYTGFRTFLKITRDDACIKYEPFAPWNGVAADATVMTIGANELELEETNDSLGLRTHIRYFTLVNEPFAGLIRRVTIQNIGNAAISIELLDGMPYVIPYGVNNYLLKEMGRTVEAWMEVFSVDANVPFYRLGASVVDRAEVETFHAGHFAFAFVKDGAPLGALVDPVLIFEQETSLYQPVRFNNHSLNSLLTQKQVTRGRTPCGFFAYEAVLSSGESLNLYAVFGHIGSQEILERHLPRLTQASYMEQKYREAIELVQELTNVVETHTSSPLFDTYCRQNFLDNVLRGGWPVKLGGHMYPVYSRKHGDPERDYNTFSLPPEPYSQGEASYRDVIQNRRDDVLLNPDIGDFDIRTYMSLIQADGYNPRAVKGVTFSLTPEKQQIVLSYTQQSETLSKVLVKPFTPGMVLRAIFENDIKVTIPLHDFLEIVHKDASLHIEADFHEGYWIDHWEYNLDLIEAYLAVYPERKDDLLFGIADIPFYDSPVVVQPRSKKYVLVNGMPRQLGSLVVDQEKVMQIAARKEQPNWTRSKNGDIYRVNLFTKLVMIVLIKFSTLDPGGMGIEMEASRPGWYDALNGLPGLFGSGVAETFELQRWLRFLIKAIPRNGNGGFHLPKEAYDLLQEVVTHLKVFRHPTMVDRAFEYWDLVSTAREKYRQRTRLGFDSAEKFVSFEDLHDALILLTEKVNKGVNRAIELNNGFPPAYFIYNMDTFEILQESDDQGRSFIFPRQFSPKVLPLFLEAPVRALKVMADKDAASKLYQDVKDSLLFDCKLNMYKVNASLELQPHDIGRARAFPPGWLENESIWLHMEYKYLLELLKAGLYKQFFVDMKNVLVPFLDPHIYGRSTLENSSFLVSSAHPDETLHGGGFVARLSGSTAEFISIWNTMMAGKNPFILQNGQLCLELRPVLPGWLFNEEGEVSFRFLGSCTVTYYNAACVDTPNLRASRWTLITREGNRIDGAGAIIGIPYAAMIRNGQIEKLDIWF